jgi:hypothetical protein
MIRPAWISSARWPFEAEVLPEFSDCAVGIEMFDVVVPSQCIRRWS